MTGNVTGDVTGGLPQHDAYPADPRTDVGAHIPAGPSSVLDVGCGRGAFGATLRARPGPEPRIVAVEAVGSSAKAARLTTHYDEVHDGYFPDALAASDERFDQIYFNDVLEHLLDPWRTLRETHAHLAPGGVVLAAIPSVQYFTVVKELLRGRWDYTDAGSLDRTHVRFFTRATMVEMFEGAGYEVDRCIGLNSIVDAWRTGQPPVRGALKRLVGRGLGDARYLQFLVVAHARPAR